MLSGTQLRVGMNIIFKGEPHKVWAVQHLTPGNKRGLVQTKLRNLHTGVSFDHRFRSDDKVERAVLEQHEMEYLYADEGGYHFMNTETYEQTVLTGEDLGDAASYLVPNVKFMVEFFEGRPVGVAPPKVVELKVVETPPNLKGATAASSQKPATLETGLVLNVPSFIEPGDLVRIDTVEGKYLERAKE
ncbi:MAG TPA: elongation factor P [Deltaproteobacteria bacterium]|nr:elongation factor P [Deltaproteobacteria bacterium]